MPDDPKPSDPRKSDIYFAKVAGQPARLIRATDVRLARKHVLASIYPPEIEVRRPTTEEAMDMALDGVTVEDATAEAAAVPAEPVGGGDAPDLNDTPRLNPEDDPE